MVPADKPHFRHGHAPTAAQLQANDTNAAPAPGTKEGTKKPSIKPPFSTSTSTNPSLDMALALVDELAAPVQPGKEREHSRRVSMILGLKASTMHTGKGKRRSAGDDDGVLPPMFDGGYEEEEEEEEGGALRGVPVPQRHEFRRSG